MTGTTPCRVRAELDATLGRCGRGSHEAFAELYDRTIGLSLRLAWWMAREQVAAERIVVESYVEVWRTAADYDPERGSALGWVLAAVRRQGLAPVA